MFPHADADAPVDRWAVRLDEPVRPPAADALGPAPEPVADDVPFLPFSLDIPTIEFQPRLSRFDEAA
jgi:hypothetical protein